VNTKVKKEGRETLKKKERGRGRQNRGKTQEKISRTTFQVWEEKKKEGGEGGAHR